MSGVTSIRAHLRRRILLSYRVDATVAQSLLPSGFRPHLVDGSAVAGICLIGLQDARPAWFAPRIGATTEAAAHRMAVEWDEGDTTHTGVFVFQRHSSSLLPTLVGGLFAGGHQRARFELEESAERFHVRMTSRDADVDVDARLTTRWRSSLFGAVEDASEFYRRGAIGWSDRGDGTPAALEMATDRWSVAAVDIAEHRSTFFDALPAGSASFDSALIMRDVDVRWDARALPTPTTTSSPAVAGTP